MKVFKFIYKATLCATLSVATLTSCVNNWLDLEPSDGVDASTAIKNSDNLGTAVAGLYSGLKGNHTTADYYARDMFLYGEVHADDMQSNTKSGTGSNRANFFYKMLYTTGTDFSGNAVWQSPYIVIGRANRIIKAADSDLADKEDAAAIIADYKNQAKVLRALALFDLARIYGKPYTKDQGASLGVPFTEDVIDPSDVATTHLSRLTVAENYVQVEKDLTEAIASNALSEEQTPGYVNLWVAKGLLARVYMTKGEWKKALDVCKDIIENSPYKLWTKDQYANAWYESNGVHGNEMMFELVINDTNDWTDREGIAYLYSENVKNYRVGYSDVVATKNFVDMLSSDPEDVRNDVFYASSDSNDKNTYGTNKVWLNKMPAVNGDPRYSNVPMMRLSEIYLTAAECAFNLGEKAVAADFLNAIIENRTSDASKVVATDNITKDRIYIERRKELVGEGHRYFDCLRRNEKIVRYTTVDNRGWHSILTKDAQTFDRDNYKAISAIPQSEINANPNIKQNDNYGE